MLRSLNYKIAYFFHYISMIIFAKTCKKPLPVSFHRQLFTHYQILLPLPVSMLAEKEVLRKVLRATFPYFQLPQAHEDIFMIEFFGFLMENRREMYTNLYKVTTELESNVIKERTNTIEIIYRDYVGVELIRTLYFFFNGDDALPERNLNELKGMLSSVLAVSASVDWGCDTRSVDT